MNSKEALEKLLKENEKARERFKKLADVPDEEVQKELQKFQKEFGIELREEDFANRELDNEQLKGVSGGVDAMDIAGLGFDVYGFVHRPDATRRGTKDGSKRFN